MRPFSNSKILVTYSFKKCSICHGIVIVQMQKESKSKINSRKTSEELIF